MKMIRYKQGELPPLTAAEKAELRALAARPDSEIDYSDIPPAGDDDEFWKNAVRGRFYRPPKTTASVRIDMDVLQWLKGQGKGWQAKTNAILRTAMLRSRHHA